MIDFYLQYIQEGYILSQSPISVGLEEFENKENDKLLIIGLCGSGKTTLAEFLSTHKPFPVDNKYPLKYPKDNWISCDTLFYRIWQKKFKGIKLTKELKKQLTIETQKEVIKILKSPKRTILEGVELIEIYRDFPQYRKLILNQSIILLNTSTIMSSIQAGLRNMAREGGEGWREIYWFMKINIKQFQRTLKLIKKDIKSNNLDYQPYKIPNKIHK